MVRFAEILKNKNFSLLWFAQVISQFGDRLVQMALIALVYTIAPGSTFQLAKLLTVTIIPVFIIGPVAGVYVDRWNRRKTLVICDFLKALLVFGISFFLVARQSLIFVYLLIFLVFCISRFYVPAKLSIIPDLVKPKNLLIANSLANTTGMVAAAFGFGLGGILVDVWGAKHGFYLASLTFLISAIMILFIGTRIVGQIKKERIIEFGKDVIEVITKSVAAEIKEGIVYLINHRDIRFIINVLFLLWSALGAIYVVAIVFIQKALGTVTKDLGLLIMFVGIGLFVGSLIYGRFGHKDRHLKTIFSCFSLSGIVLTFFVLALNMYPNFFLSAVLVFTFGAIVAPIMTAANTLIHEVSRDEMRGKVFSSLEIVMHFAFLLFMLISSKLADFIGGFWFLIYLGIIITVVGIIGFLKFSFRRQQILNYD
jgi:MFS family permease